MEKEIKRTTEFIKGRREALKFPFLLPFLDSNVFNDTDIKKEDETISPESFNFDPEEIFKEAQALYKEYIESDDYLLRLKLLFFRADKFENSEYIEGQSFSETFGDFDTISAEFENLPKEEQEKYSSQAISFKVKKIEEVINIKYKFFDNLSTDIEKNEKIRAHTIEMKEFKKILSKIEEIEQREVLNVLFTPEITEYLLLTINSEEINNLIIIKNPDTASYPNLFLQDVIHELIHINHFDMPFIQNELFIKISESKIDNKHLLETEEEKRQNDYFLKTKEIEAFFQSALIMFKKYKLIDSYNDIPTDIFTKLDARYNEISEKLKKEEKDISIEKKRSLLEEASFLLDYGGIMKYLKNMLQINADKDMPVEKTEKDALWLLQNLASVNDLDFEEKDNIKKLMNNIEIAIMHLFSDFSNTQHPKSKLDYI